MLFSEGSGCKVTPWCWGHWSGGPVVALGKEGYPWSPRLLFCTSQGAMLKTLMNNILHQLAMFIDPLEGREVSQESGAWGGVPVQVTHCL